jgi:Flp pilus assembly protein TadD
MDAGLDCVCAEDFEGAVSWYRQAAVAAPGSCRALTWLGKCLLLSDRVREALPVLRDAVALDPVDADARVALAQGLQLAGDGNGAQHELLEALRLEPGHEEAAQFLRLAQGAPDRGGSR